MSRRQLSWLGAQKTLAALGMGVVLSSTAVADDTQATVPIQKSPAVLRLQAAVTQAKLPVGNAVFRQVFLKIMSGGQAVWEKNLGETQVRNGVINLEFPGVDPAGNPSGPATTAGPTLDDVIAQNADLKLLVCIEDANNCLSEVPIAAVPLAVKATHAYQAATAAQAAEASLCHYTYGATAQPRVYARTQSQGYGRLEFGTPADVNGAPDANDPSKYAANLVVRPQSDAAGFIKWKPAVAGASELHLCAADSNDLIQPLEKLVLHATQTVVEGALVVPEHGRVEVSGPAVFSNNVAIGASGRSTTFAGGVDFTNATVTGLSGANNGITAFRVGATGQTSTLAGSLNFSGSTASNFTATATDIAGTATTPTGGGVVINEGSTNLRIDGDEINSTGTLNLNAVSQRGVRVNGNLEVTGSLPIRRERFSLKCINTCTSLTVNMTTSATSACFVTNTMGFCALNTSSGKWTISGENGDTCFADCLTWGPQ
jgi:hypothetical protein